LIYCFIVPKKREKEKTEKEAGEKN